MTSQKPVASWASLANFGGAIENVESALNEGVGGRYFDPGTYNNLLIESLEPKISQNGNPMVMLNLQSESGASIKYRIMLSKKDGAGFHFTYNQLGSAVIQDPTLRMKLFGNTFRTNPALMEALRGCRVSIEVGKGKEGYDIQKDALDNHVVIDVETKTAPEGLEGQVFGSYTEAKEAAEALSLKRAYNEVKRVFRPSAEFVTANEQALSEVVRAAESGGAVGKAAGTSSRANKPRPTI